VKGVGVAADHAVHEVPRPGLRAANPHAQTRAPGASHAAPTGHAQASLAHGVPRAA